MPSYKRNRLTWTWRYAMDAERFSQEAMRHEKLLFHVSYTLLHNIGDCADAVQEALAQAWRGRDMLRDERKFRPWLVRILINTCNGMLRTRARRAEVTLLAEMPAPPEVENWALHDALARLEQELRLPLVLHYFEGFSVGEIAGMLGLPAGTVKSRMMRGRKLMKALLGEEVVP